MPRRRAEPVTPGAAFKEEYTILENAMASERGSEVTMESHRAAIAYRHKLNRARIHHRILNESGLSRYDTLMLSVLKDSPVISITRYRGLTLKIRDIATGAESTIGGEIETPQFDPAAVVARMEGISVEEARARLNKELNEVPYDGEAPFKPDSFE